MKKILYTFLLLLFSLDLSAGGPIAIDTVNKSGTAQRWDKNTVEWFHDDGSLATNVNNQKAVQWVQEAFSTWSNVTMQTADGRSVKTVDITIKSGGSLGKDVDKTKYHEYLSATEGPSAVIFDPYGSILEDIGIDKTLIIGVTAPLLSSGDGKKILRGVTILSGYLLENNRLDPDQARAEMLHRASGLHEIGHFLNLDHGSTMAAAALACKKDGACVDGEFIPTMFPELKTPLQINLARDDKVTISWMYPSTTFHSEFCIIRGRAEDDKSIPLRGVNLLAQRVGESEGLTKEDVRAFVSGVLYPGCEPNSDYTLYGIVPEKKYQVLYEQLPSQYIGQSGFEPLPNPPQGFTAATIETSDGKSTVECSKGGEVMEMPVVKVTAANPCKNLKPNSNTSASAGLPKEGSRGCGLMRGNNSTNVLLGVSIIASIFMIARKRRYFQKGDGSCVTQNS